MLLARLMVRLLLFASAVSLAYPAAAQNAPSRPEGLPLPDSAAYVSLQAAVAELDRSASTVVADVGPLTVTWGDIADSIRAMPPIVGGIPFPALYQHVAMQLMQQEALVLRGQSTGLDKHPVVQRRMHNAADQAMAAEVLRRSLAPNLTDKALHQTYSALVATKPSPEEVQASLVMVNTQDEATALIHRLQTGADFPTLAREFSEDGTARNGGDLGYARLDMLSPEIGSVVFALAPGQMTAYPVRSHNAWFILRVEGRRQPGAPTFEAARGALEQDIIHAGAPELMREALAAAPVSYHGLAGKQPAEKTP